METEAALANGWEHCGQKHNDRYNATPAFTQITLVFQVLHSKGPLNRAQFRRPVVGRLVDELTACFIIL
jgi:hypothetical protein